MLAALLAEGAEATEKAINPVLPEGAEMLWGAIFFFMLLGLMKFVLLPPIKQAMRQRDEQVRNDLEAADKARSEAESVRRDYDVTLGEARTEAARIIDAARAEAEAERVTALAGVEAEITAQRQSAMADVETSRQAAIAQLRPVVGDLAVAAASKVVQRSVDRSAVQSTIDAHVSAAGDIGGSR